ncbi:hypothetical protein L484_008258 [Morus notabilis]|uniref:Uncharacterized protein n=1 Tax=Morus notabilis TaxID=981085 RepID=W9RIM2_9ROSA|nr:hypothetical protein L484_008258 [Morus notabilis]
MIKNFPITRTPTSPNPRNNLVLVTDRQHPDQCHHDSKSEMFMRTESNTSASDHIITNHDNGKVKAQLQKKERKVLKEGPEPPPGMPRWLRDIVEDKGGHGWERLLIQKKLSESDLKMNQNRISMPVGQLRTPDDFLSEDEMSAVLNRKNDDGNGFNDMNVTFVGPSQRT